MVNATDPLPKYWTSGVLMPKRAAASSASSPPRSAGKACSEMRVMPSSLDGEAHGDRLVLRRGHRGDDLGTAGHLHALGFELVVARRLELALGLLAAVEDRQLATEAVVAIGLP